MEPSTNLPDERGFSDTREWIFGRLPNDSGFSDEIDRQKPRNRPNNHARVSTTYLSPHIHLYDEG